MGDAKMFGKANSPKKGNGEKNEVTFSEARVPKMSCSFHKQCVVYVCLFFFDQVGFSNSSSCCKIPG